MNKQLEILCIGDVVGNSGCDALRRHLPGLKKLYNIDLTIVNGENSAEGNGIMPHSAEHIFASGADVITTGNHAFRRREIYSMLDENPFVVRPANYSDRVPGKGIAYVDLGRVIVAVINLMGVVYLDPLENPFDTADRLIEEAKRNGAKIIIVDFHAEATAEKQGMGFYLDGRISALFGTHTHIMTADAAILPNGTGYITDVGMTGPLESVLGVKPELAISRLKDHIPVRFENAKNDSALRGCIFTVDCSTYKTVVVKPLEII